MMTPGHRQTQEELERSVAILKATLESTADGILIVDVEGRILDYNQRFEEMWCVPAEVLEESDGSRLLQHSLGLVVNPDLFLAKMLELYHEIDAESNDTVALSDGRLFERVSLPHRLGGRSVGRVWSYRDVTEQRRVEEKVRHYAYHDALTELPNRLLFKDRLEQALGQARRSQNPLAVLCVDLDRFKTINDTLGHQTGDALLKEVAARLLSRRRGGDTVARLAGDEFLIMVQNLRSAEDAARVAESILGALAQPVFVEDHQLLMTAAIGVSLFPHDGDNVETLLQNADVAMYRAKEQGRHRYALYAPEMNARAMELLILESRLHTAVDREELVVHYQPQIDVRTGGVAGTEALLRWRGEDGELISPIDFITVAENTGQIDALGEWVLRTACDEARSWRRQGQLPIRLGVNLSAHQFRRQHLVESVTEILAESGFDPQDLELELTESAILQDADYAIESLKRLRDLGIGVALDDFGTGHSSLSYLKRLPITTLKIDRLFIDECATDRKDAAIVSAIIQMAHCLDLRVIAEGVETSAQTQFLRDQGCDEIQGYFFSRPLGATDFAEYIQRGVGEQLALA
jgi:diguanylate cyclase (GGDEF)-like protein/PAS domain S-box-containing protein